MAGKEQNILLGIIIITIAGVFVNRLIRKNKLNKKLNDRIKK